MCNEANHTHTHVYTHTHRVLSSESVFWAEFITPIYYVLLYLRNVIPRCISEVVIMVHYGEVTEMEQKALMDFGAGAPLSLPRFIECSLRDTPPLQNGHGATTWLRLEGAKNNYLLTTGTKRRNIHLLLVCVCVQKSFEKQQSFSSDVSSQHSVRIFTQGKHPFYSRLSSSLYLIQHSL